MPKLLLFTSRSHGSIEKPKRPLSAEFKATKIAIYRLVQPTKRDIQRCAMVKLKAGETVKSINKPKASDHIYTSLQQIMEVRLKPSNVHGV